MRPRRPRFAALRQTTERAAKPANETTQHPPRLLGRPQIASQRLDFVSTGPKSAQLAAKARSPRSASQLPEPHDAAHGHSAAKDPQPSIALDTTVTKTIALVALDTITRIMPELPLDYG